MTNTNRADSTIGIHMSDSPTMATSMCKGIAKRSTLALREQERKPQNASLRTQASERKPQNASLRTQASERKPQNASLRAANTCATGTLVEKS